MQQVNIVVPFAAGGGTDSTARLLAQKLSEKWGKPVVVENRPGGNTVIATQLVAKARPDGHTLLIANSTFAINPILSASLPYDSSKDFVPIGTVAGGPFMMLVHPSVPANDLKGMLQILQTSKPGEWNFATVGGSGIGRIVGELFALQSGTKLQHIPYKGASQIATDLLAGTVKLTIDPPNTYIMHIKSGKVKALAVTGKRLASLPNVPTFAEQGMPEFDVRSWYGLLAPAGTPKAIIQKISTDVQEILAQTEIKDKFAALELDPMPSSPEQFQLYLRTETEKFSRVVKAANIKAAD
jgi:tripartite-type tricarboxylate transporter receptor subunit TctC